MSTPDLLQQKTLSDSLEEDALKAVLPRGSQHPFWPKRAAKPKKLDLQTSIDSEHSSLTEEIFANALGNHSESEGAEQVSFGGDKSPQNVSTTLPGTKRSFHADSTQDECSFYSQARSDMTTPFNLSADKKTPPFKTASS